MQYMGDCEWWDNRFKVRTLNVMSQERILEKDIKCFPVDGKILDLACGDGRNAIYLAGLGFKVTAVDFSREALNRLNYFVKGKKLKIETKMMDLSKEDELEELGEFQVIIINHYRLNPMFYPKLINHLCTGGVLWVNGFRETPNDNLQITSMDILKDDDFSYLDYCELEDRKPYEVGERKFIRYIWRK